MSWIEASIAEICQEDDICTAWIACPASLIPTPGQYLLASAPLPSMADTVPASAIALFPIEFGPSGFRALPAYPQANTCLLPATWRPGGSLLVRGPLGRGFCLPDDLRHLALVAAGNTSSRLAALIVQAQTRKADIVLCTDLPAANLSSSIEVYPLQTFPEILPWADFVALDCPLETLPDLRKRLGFSPENIFPCPAQALVLASMPCGGLAKCGACAVPTRRGYKLACEDGPVFDLSQLLW